MRTTAFILGLIAAFVLLVGGCSGYAVGSCFSELETALETEIADESEGSTPEEVESAGAFAIIVAIYLFAAAGLVRILLRTSTIMLALSIPMLLGLIVTDATSIFAATYYLALILVVICTVQMVMVWRADKLAPSR